MAKYTLTMKVDGVALRQLLESVESELLKLPCEVAERLLNFPDFIEKLLAVDVDHGSAGAGYLLVCFKPSDFFADFRAAVFAGDLDRFILEHFG